MKAHEEMWCHGNYDSAIISKNMICPLSNTLFSDLVKSDYSLTKCHIRLHAAIQNTINSKKTMLINVRAMLKYFNRLHNISVHIISWKVILNMIQLRVKTCHIVRNWHLQKQMVVIRITCLLHLSFIKDANNVSCSPKAFSA